MKKRMAAPGNTGCGRFLVVQIEWMFFDPARLRFLTRLAGV